MNGQVRLTFETREGILKHCSQTRAMTLGDVGERFLSKRQPGLEAQLTNIADQIAYNNHDVDDGLRAGLLSIEQMCEVPLFARFHAEVSTRYSGLAPRQLRHETIRRMINALVIDLHGETSRRLAEAGPADIDAVRAFDVKDQALPLPFNLGATSFSSTQFFNANGTLSEQPWILRKHQAFRPVQDAAFFYSSVPGEFTNSRLVGRSVWNSGWKLVIPAKTLLNNEQDGLNRFVASVKDIELFLRTYSHSGN